MSEDAQDLNDLNDIKYLASMPGKDIYGVPVGNMVNAIEAGAERIATLELELAEARKKYHDEIHRGRLATESLLRKVCTDCLMGCPHHTEKI